MPRPPGDLPERLSRLEVKGGSRSLPLRPAVAGGPRASPPYAAGRISAGIPGGARHFAHEGSYARNPWIMRDF